ncbi:MAG: endonuclease III [Planctomyces sp.]|nr:endonuclease III [Planctomyces sp.]
MAKKKASPKPLSTPSTTSDPKSPENIRKVLQTLGKLYPIAECALHHQSAFQLLVATILSAQCTDERVNQATPELFSLYPTADALARATQEDVERIVKPLGFFRNKAANIRAMAAALVDRHQGEVPESLEELVLLPGVGRKTASVVLGTWFGIPSGVVVDTHVKRLTNLLGLTESSNPEIIERDLIALIPRSEWIMFSHRLIHHGRKVCIARRPRCTECDLLPLCPRTSLPPLPNEV